ncbi:MAG: ComF family protein [Candidatus Omnitrophica bacterium]|nr:ComF family protein [Candidatus Omnitrophota bacterium]
MFRSCLEIGASLIFPATCELCERPARAGVCASCRQAIRLIEPPFCPSCGRTLHDPDAALCAHCREETFHFDRAYACTWYEGPAKELLHTYKFNGRKFLKNYFAALLEDFMRLHLDPARFDGVLAVPIDREKKSDRGFNQSGFLSQAVARTFGMNERSSWLLRTQAGTPQARLTKARRRTNVHGSFHAAEDSRLAGAKLLLIDDILTTGHTASECARVLKTAGAAAVTTLAVARGR